MTNYKFLMVRFIVLSLILSFWSFGCGSGSEGADPASWETDDHDFTLSTDLQARIDALKALLPESVYDTITADSRNNILCREENRTELGLPDTPNGQWYYTYDNMIAGMARLEEFANEGDENTRKLEIAAFLANVAQETGGSDASNPDPYGAPGCFVQEGHGEATSWADPKYGGLAPNGKGYIGRGPHQLTWKSNYASFGESVGAGDEYDQNPDVLTTDPSIGIAGSIWFWGHEEYTEWSPPNIPLKPAAHDVVVGTWTPTDEFTEGVRTSNDVMCNRTVANFGIIINLINGGIECGSTASADGRTYAQNRVRYLRAIAELMGVTIPDGFADDCSTQSNFGQCTSY